MKLVLIGFMGSGKTVVSTHLSARLNLPCIEMDELILKKSGHSSISKIFEEKGESCFRDLETEVAADLKFVSGIISTGGGAVTARNLPSFRAGDGKLVYLSTRFETLKERLKGDQTRPLFVDPQKAHALYTAREKTYQESADYTIVTDSLTPTQICEEIVRLVS